LDEIEDASVPICLHLDHATTIADIKEAVEVGYCSVMIDASTEPWEINLERTLEAVDIAHPHGVSVESELGQIMLGDGYYKQDQVDSLFTDPEKAAEFVELTGIDALAISIGNVHGAYRGEPKIDFLRLKQIRELVEVPLVLHGSSGIGEDNLVKAIQLGIRKINLYSEMVNSAHANLKESLKEDFGDPLKLCQARAKGVKEALSAYLEISGSVNTVHSKVVKPNKRGIESFWKDSIPLYMVPQLVYLNLYTMLLSEHIQRSFNFITFFLFGPSQACRHDFGKFRNGFLGQSTNPGSFCSAQQQVVQMGGHFFFNEDFNLFYCIGFQMFEWSLIATCVESCSSAVALKKYSGSILSNTSLIS
jgi:ketose-bisphosphate aldolase